MEFFVYIKKIVFVAFYTKFIILFLFGKGAADWPVRSGMFLAGPVCLGSVWTSTIHTRSSQSCLCRRAGRVKGREGAVCKVCEHFG